MPQFADRIAWAADTSATGFTNIVAAGFNVIANHGTPDLTVSTGAAINTWLNGLPAGVRATVFCGSYSGSGNWSVTDGTLNTQIPAMAGNPNIFGYMLSDEPHQSDSGTTAAAQLITQGDFIKRYRLLKGLDAKTRVTTVINWLDNPLGRIYSYGWLLGCLDYVMLDLYPNFALTPPPPGSSQRPGLEDGANSLFIDGLYYDHTLISGVTGYIDRWGHGAPDWAPLDAVAGLDYSAPRLSFASYPVNGQQGCNRNVGVGRAWGGLIPYAIITYCAGRSAVSGFTQPTVNMLRRAYGQIRQTSAVGAGIFSWHWPTTAVPAEGPDFNLDTGPGAAALVAELTAQNAV